MKLYISKKNKMSLLKFATEHVIWTEEQWDCVHFSGESKFNLFGCDGRRFVKEEGGGWYASSAIERKEYVESISL